MPFSSFTSPVRRHISRVGGRITEEEAHQLDQDVCVIFFGVFLLYMSLTNIQVRKTMEHLQSSWGYFKNQARSPDGNPPLVTEVLNEAGMWIRDLKDQMPEALNALNAITTGLSSQIGSVADDLLEQKQLSREMRDQMDALLDEVKKRESGVVRDAVGPVLTEEVIPNFRKAFHSSANVSGRNTPTRRESLRFSGESSVGGRQGASRRSHSPPSRSISSAQRLSFSNYPPQTPIPDGLFTPLASLSASIPSLPRQFTSAPRIRSLFVSSSALELSPTRQHRRQATDTTETPTDCGTDEVESHTVNSTSTSQGSISYFDTEMGETD